MLDILSRGSDRVFGNAWSNWRRASEVIPIVMGEESISENVHDSWNWLRNPFPPANEHRSFKGIRQRLRMEDSDFVIQGGDIDKLKRPDITKLHRVLHDYGRQYNPFIRHIVRRTRAYLENTIDETTGEPYFKPVSVRLFGEDNRESLELPFYCREAYQHAEEFCELLGRRVRSAGLYKTLLLRRIGSTMFAGQKTIKNLLDKNEPETENTIAAWSEEDDELDELEDSDSPSRDLASDEIELLRQCQQLLEDNQEKDPKYQEVKQYLIDRDWLGKGCIIFSQYYDSVMWLATQLSSLDLPNERIGIYSGES